MKNEKRDSAGKLKGIWEPETNTVTIRDYIGKVKYDISFKLNADGTIEVKEKKVV